MATYKIAVIPGDGIGLEVVPAAITVLDHVANEHGFTLDWDVLDWGSERYVTTGQMLPPDGLARLREHDAIFLGAVGRPDVPDHVSLWGLLIPIRRTFRQYVNLRPVRLFAGLRSPLADRGPDDIDFLIVRENNEGEYSRIGGRIYEGTDDEIVVQEAVFTRRGVDRILRYAFELAAARPAKRLTSATKSNGIVHSMPFWDERVAAISPDFPDVQVDQFHIDILTAHFVQHPDWFDVVVASNLFGDILSDLGPAIAGGIGLAPSANINPERDYPSMFEPVHGSAPDIAGRSIANPIAQIWSGAMMLDHLGEAAAAEAVLRAIARVLSEGHVLTRDLGGTAGTVQMAEAIVTAMRSVGEPA
jgi:tartrate dehydrogenase/decarboxylase/D-malate dehydrogenase